MESGLEPEYRHLGVLEDPDRRPERLKVIEEGRGSLCFFLRLWSLPFSEPVPGVGPPLLRHPTLRDSSSGAEGVWKNESSRQHLPPLNLHSVNLRVLWFGSGYN